LNGEAVGMADFRALHSVIDGIVRRLDRSCPPDLRAAVNASFSVLAGGQWTADPAPTAITLWPFRVHVNEHQRNVELRSGAQVRNRPLPLDMHFLMTVWGTNSANELTLFGWALREMYSMPTLDASTFTTVDARWRAEEIVQVSPADMSIEDMARLWDAVRPDYRLSVAFVARVVQIDIESEDAPNVVVRRLSFEEVEA
jgi:hypothetical protein